MIFFFTNHITYQILDCMCQLTFFFLFLFFFFSFFSMCNAKTLSNINIVFHSPVLLGNFLKKMPPPLLWRAKEIVPLRANMSTPSVVLLELSAYGTRKVNGHRKMIIKTFPQSNHFDYLYGCFVTKLINTNPWLKTGKCSTLIKTPHFKNQTYHGLLWEAFQSWKNLDARTSRIGGSQVDSFMSIANYIDLEIA